MLPGVYALIGAASMLSGVCRITITLTVILHDSPPPHGPTTGISPPAAECHTHTVRLSTPHCDPRGHRVTKPIATGMGHDSWVPRVIRRDGNQSLYLIPRQVLHAARLPSLSLAQHSLTGSLKNHRFWRCRAVTRRRTSCS